jgi:hypothetical protein
VSSSIYCVYLDSEVVSGEDVTSAVAELDVRNGGYYLGEEGAGAGILWFLKHCTYVMEETGIRANVLRDASSEQLLVVLAIGNPPRFAPFS